VRTRPRLVVLLTAVTLGAAAPALGDDPAPQQISVDPLSDVSGQHETAVEPDSFAFGNTVVAAFQIGRWRTAGASGIGWATSVDGGTTWKSGVLPSLTVHGSRPGPYTRSSDPAVAYDSAHSVWLISVLALLDGPGGSNDELLSALITSRSPDGLSWSSPVVTAPTQDHYSHDKNWIVCDNDARSPLRGRCYVTWTAVVGNREALGVASSTDGGVSWSPPTIVTSIAGSAWQPLVQPDGSLVIVFVTSRDLKATRSADGGTSFSTPVTIASLRDSPTPGLRAPSLPSAELDADGRITVGWPDCRFRPACGRVASPTDLVITSSTDGRRWTRVRRVPTGPDLDGLAHVLVGLGVDPSTSGTRARIGIAFYALAPRGCTEDCQLAPFFVSSSDNGQGWSTPEALAAPQPLTSYPEAGSTRFLGDYISTSFVSGSVAVPVFANALRPYDGRYHQGIFGKVVAPQLSIPTLRIGRATLVPRRPRPGKRFSASVSVAGLTAGLRLRCQTDRAARQARLVARHITPASASCTWFLPDSRTGQKIAGTITLMTPETDVRRRFAFRAPE
jgi:hypothetical protein